MNIINPAYAGTEGKDVLSLTSRNQWMNIDNAPRTLVMSFSSERKKNVGLGISIELDKVFIEKQTFMYLDFSYKLQINQTTKLFLGLKAGGNFYKADTENLISTSNYNDPSQINLSRINPNFGAGLYLKGEKLWISLSVPRFFKVKRDKDMMISAKERIHNYLAMGYSFNISKDFEMKPGIMLRQVKGLPLNSEINNFIAYKNKYEIGVSLASNSSLSIMSLMNISKGIDLGYAYQTSSGIKLSGLILKTHELVLRIKFENLVKESDSEKEEEKDESEKDLN
jgi:type IX secretion system PorP/SprF family membrane protein